MTTFIQIIDYRTSKGEEIEKLLDEWRDSTEGRRGTASAVTCRDREDDGHYLTIVEFPSHEEAMRNNELPETRDFAARMTALCDGQPRYLNLDEVRRDKA
jgi:quinol monooxygenase YgiN